MEAHGARPLVRRGRQRVCVFVLFRHVCLRGHVRLGARLGGKRLPRGQPLLGRRHLLAAKVVRLHARQVADFLAQVLGRRRVSIVEDEAHGAAEGVQVELPRRQVDRAPGWAQAQG